MSKIKYVIKLVEDSKGERVEWVVDGGSEPADVYWAVKDGLTRPIHTVETRLLLDTGETISLPFREFAYLLPDRSGVFVIFKSGSYTHPDGSDVFENPNNAAIFNADGSLRFQVRLADPRVHHIDSMHGGTLPENFQDKLGVLVCFSTNDLPQWAYVVDPNSPEIVSAKQWVRW